MSQGGYPGGLGGDLGGEGGVQGGYPKYPISWGVGGRGVYLPHYPGEGGVPIYPISWGGGGGGVQGGVIFYPISWGGGGGGVYLPHYPGEGGGTGGVPKIPKSPVTEGGFPRYSGGGTLSLICLIRTFQKKGSR